VIFTAFLVMGSEVGAAVGVVTFLVFAI
jgi:hypothetical protein